MFEHVGQKNYAAYFDVVRRVLSDNGLFRLHTIGAGVGGELLPLSRVTEPLARGPRLE